MKNHHEVSGVIINIILALLILAFIVIGLNKIGIYRLPDSVEKFLGLNRGSETDAAVDSDTSSKYEQLSFDFAHIHTETGILTYENARKLVESIDYNVNYSQSISVCNYIGDKTYTERVSLECIDGLYSASLNNVDGVLIRQIQEDHNSVNITTFDNGNATVVSLPKGSFDISDECGFVITAKDFINSDYNLEEADFSLFECEYGAAVSVRFINIIDSLSVEEEYVISLDYGVILSVKSSIDGNVVYSMSTETLERIV